MRAGVPAIALALLAAGIVRAAAPDGIDDLVAAPAARLMAREKRALVPAARKLDTRLRPLAWPVRKTSPRSPLVAAAPMQHVADGRVRVYVRLTALDEDALARLRACGVEVEMVDRAGGRAQAVVDARQLRDLAALPSVLAIRPAERGRLRTGSVTSEADASGLSTTTFDSATIQPGATFIFTPQRPGLVRYVCTLHPTVMSGTIKVLRG